MSTEIKTSDTSMPEEVATPPAMAREAAVATGPSTIAKSRPWQQRRYQFGAGIMALVLVLGIVGNNLIAGQYTPEGAVRQFFSALQSRDAATAWSEIQITAPPSPVTASLTDEAALRAALAAIGPDVKNFDVTNSTSTGAGSVTVSFSYDTSGGTKQGALVVQRSGERRFAFYPVWHLVITPAILKFALPVGSAGVTIDGKALALPSGNSAVAVLPLTHKVQLNGTQMLAAQTLSVDAFFSAGQSVAYQPKLTATGMDRAKGAVKASFDSCAKQTDANPDPQTCPQGARASGSGSWQLIGDPTQDLAITIDNDLNVAGVGHYQMLFAFPDSSGPNHAASGGGYSAAIVLAATDLVVANIQSLEGLPALTRPRGATDQAALALVGKAFAQCAKVQAEAVADCPQSPPDFVITNVRWKLIGDPLANATVSFDPTNGMLTVHGKYDMSVTYRQFGFPKSGSSWTPVYSALLLWDGQALRLVRITGSVL
jgi:hypothetical protein